MFPFAKETQLFLLLLATLAGVMHYQFGMRYAVPVWVVLIMLAYFLRDFKHEIPSIPLANVSPVDGTIKEICNARDPYLKRDAVKISIRQKLSGEFNAHSPIEGKVMERWFNTGDSEDLEIPRHHFAVWIRTDEMDDVVVEVDLTTIPRYYQCQVQPGERLGQGRRCGFIGFGRMVNTYLPANVQVQVKPGDKLTAGSDVIAEFVHES